MVAEASKAPFGEWRSRGDHKFSEVDLSGGANVVNNAGLQGESRRKLSGRARRMVSQEENNLCFAINAGHPWAPARNSAVPAGKRWARRRPRLRSPGLLPAGRGPSPTDGFSGTFSFWRAFGWPPQFC